MYGAKDQTYGVSATLSSTAIDLPQARSPTSILRWYVLILTCLIYAINIADRYVVSTVLEPIRLELHLDDEGVAFLTGTPLALFYVTFGIPISWCADRIEPPQHSGGLADHLVGIHHRCADCRATTRNFCSAASASAWARPAARRRRPPSCRITFRRTGGPWR